MLPALASASPAASSSSQRGRAARRRPQVERVEREAVQAGGLLVGVRLERASGRRAGRARSAVPPGRRRRSRAAPARRAARRRASSARRSSASTARPCSAHAARGREAVVQRVADQHVLEAQAAGRAGDVGRRRRRRSPRRAGRAARRPARRRGQRARRARNSRPSTEASTSSRRLAGVRWSSRRAITSRTLGGTRGPRLAAPSIASSRTISPTNSGLPSVRSCTRGRELAATPGSGRRQLEVLGDLGLG